MADNTQKPEKPEKPEKQEKPENTENKVETTQRPMSRMQPVGAPLPDRVVAAAALSPYNPDTGSSPLTKGAQALRSLFGL